LVNLGYDSFEKFSFLGHILVSSKHTELWITHLNKKEWPISLLFCHVDFNKSKTFAFYRIFPLERVIFHNKLMP